MSPPRHSEAVLQLGISWTANINCCLVLTWPPLQAYSQAQGAAQGPANQSFTQVCKVQEALSCLLLAVSDCI